MKKIEIKIYSKKNSMKSNIWPMICRHLSAFDYKNSDGNAIKVTTAYKKVSILAFLLHPPEEMEKKEDSKNLTISENSLDVTRFL